MQGVTFAQIAGQQVAVARQGNVQQVINLPLGAVQQTIPVQIPISTANGQTVLQTVHLPVQAIQAVAAGNVQHVTAQVVPQIQQVSYFETISVGISRKLMLFFSL